MQLIIDTSSENSLLALNKDGNIIASRTYPHVNNLSATLLPNIQALVKEAGLTFQQLTSIAVGVGPGSYTGTRVGVAVAKTLSFGLKIPLKSFCSLLAFLPNITGSFACVMPSRTSDLFVLKGGSTSDQIELTTSALLSRSSAMEALKGVETVMCIGGSCEGIAAPEVAPPPGFDSILKWLNLAPLEHKSPDAELIYLHTP